MGSKAQLYFQLAWKEDSFESRDADYIATFQPPRSSIINFIFYNSLAQCYATTLAVHFSRVQWRFRIYRTDLQDA